MKEVKVEQKQHRVQRVNADFNTKASGLMNTGMLTYSKLVSPSSTISIAKQRDNTPRP